MTDIRERLIRVLLVDDHAVVRKGLWALLEREPGVEVTGEAEDGEQAWRMVDRMQPDVILMDIEMPGTGGIGATRRFSETRHGKRNREPVGPLVDLLPTALALFCDRLQLWDGRLHDLHDDLSGDVRLDAERGDPEAAQGASRKEIEESCELVGLKDTL
jgi:CheY-like chemotaxis protein